MKEQQIVTLMRYVRTDNGWTRRRVNKGTGRGWEQHIDHNLAAFGPDVKDLGEYHLRWYERRGKESKARYASAGSTYMQAKIALVDRENRLDLIRASLRAGVQPPAEVLGSKPLDQCLEPFLKIRRATSKITSENTCDQYRVALSRFIEITKVRYIEQVNINVLAEFLAGLEERGLSEQTRFLNYVKLAALFRECDEGLAKMLREFTPKVSRKNPVSYTQEDLNALLNYLRSQPQYEYLALAVEMYYKTGLREKELTFLTWDEIDFKRGTFCIVNDRSFRLVFRGKEREVRFRTKTRRDRKIPIPIEACLLERLRQWRKRHPDDRFLFSTWNGNPDQTLLTKIRTAACHAGLNCGKCDSCLRPCGLCKNCRCHNCSGCRKRSKCINAHRSAEAPCMRVACKKWKLHRLRHTFATTAIRKGADLAMVMDLLGHTKLSTTQVYISAAREAEAQSTVNRIFGD